MNTACNRYAQQRSYRAVIRYGLLVLVFMLSGFAHGEGRTTLITSAGFYDADGGELRSDRSWYAFSVELALALERHQIVTGIFQGMHWLKSDGIDASFIGDVDDEVFLVSQGVQLGYHYLLGDERLVPYLGGGVGLYQTTMTATGEQLGIRRDREETYWSLGLHGSAGIGYRFDAVEVGVRLRQQWISPVTFEDIDKQIDPGGLYSAVVLSWEL